MKNNAKPSGFTLVELLVVIAIIGILVSLMLPAVGGARETARRIQCEARMANLALGMQQYEMAEQQFPAGVQAAVGPIRNEPRGLHHNWIISLLPFIDEPVAFEMIDLQTSVYIDQQKSVRERTIPGLQCPSAPRLRGVNPSSHYAGVHHHVESPINDDNAGILYLNSATTRDDVSDGLQYTFLIGEKIVDKDRSDLGWMSGTTATLRNTGWLLNDPVVVAKDQDPGLVVGGFGSWHTAGGAQFILANGSTDYVAGIVDRKILQQLGNRSDGELIRLEDVN